MHACMHPANANTTRKARVEGGSACDTGKDIPIAIAVARPKLLKLGMEC